VSWPRGVLGGAGAQPGAEISPSPHTAFRGDPHGYVPVPTWSIARIPALGAHPMLGTCPSPEAPGGHAEGTRELRGCQSSGVGTRSPSLGERRAMGPVRSAGGGWMDRQTVLSDSTQQIWGTWTPAQPVSSASRGSNDSILAHYTACVRWRNDENEHFSALKPFVPLLILSISSANR